MKPQLGMEIKNILKPPPRWLYRIKQKKTDHSGQFKLNTNDPLVFIIISNYGPLELRFHFFVIHLCLRISLN